MRVGCVKPCHTTYTGNAYPRGDKYSPGHAYLVSEDSSAQGRNLQIPLPPCVARWLLDTETEVVK